MGQSYWSTSGFGIDGNSLKIKKGLTLRKIIETLKSHGYEADPRDILREDDYDDDMLDSEDIEDILSDSECEEHWLIGAYPFLMEWCARYIKDKHDIELDLLEDEDGDCYLMLCSAMPWDFTDEVKSLTAKSLTEMFNEGLALFFEEEHNEPHLCTVRNFD